MPKHTCQFRTNPLTLQNNKSKNKGQNIVIIKIGKTNIFCLYGEKIEKISISTFKNLIINTKKVNTDKIRGKKNTKNQQSSSNTARKAK